MNILPLFRESHSCDYHRVILPLSEMGIDLFEKNRLPYLQALKSHPVVFFNRLPTEPVDSFLLKKKQIGFKYVVDLDDYFSLFPGHYLQYQWEGSKMTESLIMILKNADMVITTNGVLADKIKEYNSWIQIIPNALPFDKGQFTPRKSGELFRVTRFIYVAGASHAHDTMIMHDPLYMLNRARFSNEETYEICLAGIDAKNRYSEKQWEYMISIMSLNGKMSGNGHYKQMPSHPVTDYMKLYDYSDVAIAPLQDYEFNTCKSNLKVLEAGAKGIAIITSEIHPYLNKKDNGYVITCNSPRDWFDSMKYLIENPSYRRETAEALAAHVRKEYQLSDANEIRRQIFEHLIKS
jgi:glycosyltransferase involved in cell wall biosynthesis